MFREHYEQLFTVKGNMCCRVPLALLHTNSAVTRFAEREAIYFLFLLIFGVNSEKVWIVTRLIAFIHILLLET